MERESQLAQAYLYHRQNRWRPAYAALRLARDDIAAGKRRYAHSVNHEYGGNWQSLDDSPRMRREYARAYYCDNFPDGWRELGRADEVCRANDRPRAIDHTGWFTDDFQDATMAGYVLQLPARDGVPQYVPATKHSDWDGVTLYPLDRYDDPVDAARAADGYAEHVAEKERDYNRAWQAGNEAAELEQEAKETRKTILQVCADLRTARRSVAPSEAIERLCGMARTKVSSLLEDIAEARSKRDKLIIDFGREPGFRENYPA